jgi:hypothetical protein
LPCVNPNVPDTSGYCCYWLTTKTRSQPSFFFQARKMLSGLYYFALSKVTMPPPPTQEIASCRQPLSRRRPPVVCWQLFVYSESRKCATRRIPQSVFVCSFATWVVQNYPPPPHVLSPEKHRNKLPKSHDNWQQMTTTTRKKFCFSL